MRAADYLFLITTSIRSNKMRSVLTTLGIAIGICAVALLTALGSGANQYVMNEFTQFGTNIIQIQPGKITTFGSSLGALNTVRPLSIDDTAALARLPGVTTAVGFSMGNAEVEGNGRQRRTTVYGTDPDFCEAFTYQIELGQFLPRDDPHSPRPLAVIGHTIYAELYDQANPLGRTLGVGGDRFRIVGVMRPKGQMMGIDLDDAVYVPTARGMALFDQDTLMEINLVHADWAPASDIVAQAQALLLARHGADDVTVTTQQQMMEVMASVLTMLSAAVAGLGGISLVVGCIGVLTIMIIAVRERHREIGLLRALGATRRQILLLFLGESALLAGAGGLAGLLAGIAGAVLIHLAIPALPLQLPAHYLALAELCAVVAGVIAGIVPAALAARLTPVTALRSE